MQQGWLVVWCFQTLLSTAFLLYRRGQCTYPCFPLSPFNQYSTEYSYQATVNPLPHMANLGPSNSAANKDMMSKIWTYEDTII